MFADYHLHSSFSADSTTPMDRQIQKAFRIGLEEICFTEHLEYDFHLGDWHVDIDGYKKAVQKYQDQGIPVKLGFEAGLSCTPEHLRTIECELKNAEPDFILVSLHEFHHTNPYREDFFIGDPIQICRQYFQCLHEKLQCFDEKMISSVAHIDYIAKGFGRTYLPDGILRYRYAPDELDMVFRWVIEQGKCIEINTSTYRGLAHADIPGRDWLKRYVELGGEYVTIGADAHTTEHVGFMLKEAMQLAQEAGITYVATFDHMSPVLHPL